MIDNEAFHNIYSKVREELQKVSDSISPNSVRSKQSQIDVLSTGNQILNGFVYYDRSNWQYDNSINLFAKEIQANRQHLRSNGLDLQDYREDFKSFIQDFITPLREQILHTKTDIENEIIISKRYMPVEPTGFSDTDDDGTPCIGYLPGQYESYQTHYDAWSKGYNEILSMFSELKSLEITLEFIEATIRKNISIKGNNDYWEQVVDEKPDNEPTIDQSSSLTDYKSFEELFINKNDIDKCINALRRIEPPLINETGKWIGRQGSKSKLAAWIRRLEDCHIIHFISDKRILSPLINAYFPGLKLGKDARTLADPDKEAYSVFTAMILQ